MLRSVSFKKFWQRIVVTLNVGIVDGCQLIAFELAPTMFVTCVAQAAGHFQHLTSPKVSHGNALMRQIQLTATSTLSACCEMRLERCHCCLLALLAESLCTAVMPRRCDGQVGM